MKTANKRVIHVDIIDKIDSTNSFLKDNCDTLPLRYTLRALTQYAGRGRFNRSWLSESGDDLTFSTLVPVSHKLQEYLLNIPQVTALSLYETLLDEAIESEIKWPNDILVNGKKIAGILVEGIFQNGKQYLVVGIGLNVNSSAVKNVDIATTSMKTEALRLFDANMLMDKIVNKLYDLLDILENHGFSVFKDTAEKVLAYRDEWKDIELSGEKIRGLICGVDHSGALLIQKESGEMLSIISGEISFKKGV